LARPGVIRFRSKFLDAGLSHIPEGSQGFPGLLIQLLDPPLSPAGQLKVFGENFQFVLKVGRDGLGLRIVNEVPRLTWVSAEIVQFVPSIISPNEFVAVENDAFDPPLESGQSLGLSFFLAVVAQDLPGIIILADHRPALSLAVSDQIQALEGEPLALDADDPQEGRKKIEDLDELSDPGARREQPG